MHNTFCLCYSRPIVIKQRQPQYELEVNSQVEIMLSTRGVLTTFNFPGSYAKGLRRT